MKYRKSLALPTVKRCAMLYRIDTFSLPEAARPEFELRSAQTISLLRRQPGFVRDHWFEKVSGHGSVNLITMVEWEDEASIQSAAQVVRAMHSANGFDAADFVQRHGIIESKAVYRSRKEAASA
jgi:Antibiotic biosynthesis monooxygenase